MEIGDKIQLCDREVTGLATSGVVVELRKWTRRDELRTRSEYAIDTSMVVYRPYGTTEQYFVKPVDQFEVVGRASEETVIRLRDRYCRYMGREVLPEVVRAPGSAPGASGVSGRRSD